MNPDSPNDGRAFGTLEIQLAGGSVYVLPYVPPRAFAIALREVPKRNGSFAVTNLVGACLVVPMRLVR